MAFPEAQELTALLTEFLAPRGIDVEHVKTTKAGKKSQVVVRVDSETHPTSDELETLSNDIGAFFDAKEEEGVLNFGAGYTLEVSTPGVDLPLIAPRHWRRNRGRAVAVERLPDDAGETPVASAGKRGGKIAVWRIGALSPDEDSVILVRQEKKKLEAIACRLDKIAHAVVEIEFSKPPEEEASAAQMDYEQAVTELVTGREEE